MKFVFLANYYKYNEKYDIKVASKENWCPLTKLRDWMIKWKIKERFSERKVAIVAGGSWGNSRYVLHRSSEHFLAGFFPSRPSFRVALQHCNCRFFVWNTCLECPRGIEVSLRLFRVRRKWFSKRFKQKGLVKESRAFEEARIWNNNGGTTDGYDSELKFLFTAQFYCRFQQRTSGKLNSFDFFVRKGKNLVDSYLTKRTALLC